MFNKIKYTVKYHCRARLSYFLNCVLLSVLSFFVINIITSIYVGVFPDIKISQPVSRLANLGFSLSTGYGFIYSSVVLIMESIFMLLNVQRLRDMGYRYPVAVSLVLIILSAVSNLFYDLVKINFISLFIDVGLLVFFMMMLFTKSKKRTAH